MRDASAGRIPKQGRVPVRSYDCMTEFGGPYTPVTAPVTSRVFGTGHAQSRYDVRFVAVGGRGENRPLTVRRRPRAVRAPPGNDNTINTEEGDRLWWGRGRRCPRAQYVFIGTVTLILLGKIHCLSYSRPEHFTVQDSTCL